MANASGGSARQARGAPLASSAEPTFPKSEQELLYEQVATVRDRRKSALRPQASVPLAGQLVPPHALLPREAAHRPSVNDGVPTRTFDLAQATQFARDLQRIARSSANDGAPSPRAARSSARDGSRDDDTLREEDDRWARSDEETRRPTHRGPTSAPSVSTSAPGSREQPTSEPPLQLVDASVPSIEQARARLSHEAELWRELTVRSLARAARAERIAGMTAIGSWFVAVAGGVFGLMTMLLGFERSTNAALVAVGTMATSVAASAVVAAVAHGIRRSQAALAQSMADRASAIEARLDRYALLLALRDEDRGSYCAALSRLELPER
jgi:hypothetical protein